jgi:hypothetical protein
MEVVFSSEAFVSTNKSTRCYYTEDRHRQYANYFILAHGTNSLFLNSYTSMKVCGVMQYEISLTSYRSIQSRDGHVAIFT